MQNKTQVLLLTHDKNIIFNYFFGNVDVFKSYLGGGKRRKLNQNDPEKKPLSFV